MSQHDRVRRDRSLEEYDEDSCDDCEELPDGWVCADCYIKQGEDSEAIDS